MTKVITVPLFGNLQTDLEQQSLLSFTAGIYTTKIPKETLDNAIKEALAIGNQSLIDFNKSIPANEYIIVVQEGFKEFMGDLFDVVLDHERGHIFHDHLEGVDATKKQIMNSVEKEKEADFYAAKIHGAEKTAEGLVKALEYSLWTRLGYTPNFEKNKKVWMKQFISQPEFLERIKTLKELHMAETV